jgi:hypothetical protein
LIVRWDDRLADRIAAENLFLDQSKERRRAAVEDLHTRFGACTPPGSFDVVENALRGSWRMACERSTLRVSITLAPTLPPKVQFIGVAPTSGEPSRSDNCSQN